MKILKPGHKYELGNFEHREKPGQKIQFIEKKAGLDYPGILKTVKDGTTNEEVIEMLIDRMEYLQRMCSCTENDYVIMKLKEALYWLHERTINRISRGVEGKPEI